MQSYGRIQKSCMDCKNQTASESPPAAGGAPMAGEQASVLDFSSLPSIYFCRQDYAAPETVHSLWYWCNKTMTPMIQLFPSTMECTIRYNLDFQDKRRNVRGGGVT